MTPAQSQVKCLSVNKRRKIIFYQFCVLKHDLNTWRSSLYSNVHCPSSLLFLLSLPYHSPRNFTQGPVNMYNCLVVTVSGSTFANNHATSVFTDLPSRVSGGGLSVTIYGNSSVVNGRFKCSIQSCTFSNNSANSTVPPAGTISVLKGSHINGRGGGVALFVSHSAVVGFTVLHCNFTNNSAPFYGGGLYAFSPHLVTEEDFTIAGNHFERNKARTGGGIILGVALLETDRMHYLKKSDLTDSVIIHRNTFVQNRGVHGGAMYLSPSEWVFSYSACVP